MSNVFSMRFDEMLKHSAFFAVFLVLIVFYKFSLSHFQALWTWCRDILNFGLVECYACIWNWFCNSKLYSASPGVLVGNATEYRRLRGGWYWHQIEIMFCICTLMFWHCTLQFYTHVKGMPCYLTFLPEISISTETDSF